MMLFRLSILACIIMLIVQMIWYHFGCPAIYFCGDALFKCGILYAISRLSKWKSFYYFIILDFFFNLSVIDYLFRILCNPFKINTNQYVLFIICQFVSILRLIMHYTKLDIKSLIKNVFRREA